MDALYIAKVCCYLERGGKFEGGDPGARGSKIPSQHMTSGTHQEDGIVWTVSTSWRNDSSCSRSGVDSEGIFRLATGKPRRYKNCTSVSIGITILEFKRVLLESAPGGPGPRGIPLKRKLLHGRKVMLFASHFAIVLGRHLEQFQMAICGRKTTLIP